MKVPGTCTDDRPLSANTSGGIRPCLPNSIPMIPTIAIISEIRSGPMSTSTRSPAQFDNDLQVDPELAEGPASNSRIALFAVGIAVVLGLVFYGLNNSSRNQQNAATAPAPATTAQKSASTSPPAPPGMRDVTPRAPNSQPGTTTGSAPASPQPPPATTNNLSNATRRPLISAASCCLFVRADSFQRNILFSSPPG